MVSKCAAKKLDMLLDSKRLLIPRRNKASCVPSCGYVLLLWCILARHH